MDFLVGVIQTIVVVFVLGFLFLAYLGFQDKYARKYGIAYLGGAIGIASIYGFVHHSVQQPPSANIDVANPTGGTASRARLSEPNSATATFNNMPTKGERLTVKCTGPTGNVVCRSVR